MYLKNILTVISKNDRVSFLYLNADKHSPTDRSQSDCVHEQVAKRIANVRFTADKHSPASLHWRMIKVIKLTRENTYEVNKF